jgi:glycosyltransferase involved in cell wall biosynthesis
LLPKRLLIISYHALPLEVVASYRTKGYCDYLSKYGVLPTLITHHWENQNVRNRIYHDVDDKVVYEKYDNYNIIRLPRPSENFNSSSSIKTLKHWLKGDFDIHLLNSYDVFKSFLFQHLQSQKYDGVLAIFSPHYHLKLAYEIYQKFKIPYVLDFRDLWDNQVITKSYRPSLKKRIQDFLIKYYWKRWLKKSLFFSTTSHKWTEYLKKLSNEKGFVFPNGHEIEIVETPIKQAKFNLTYFGRFYPNQNLELIVEGINEFLKKVNPKNFKLQLIGIKKTSNFDGLQFITSRINTEYLEVVDYLPKEELMDFCKKEVTLFFLPSFFEDNGQFMVKLYDFIALGKPVLVAPRVNSDMEIVVKKTKSGAVLNSSESIALHLEEQYNYFLKFGHAKNNMSSKSISDYHRQNQIKLFAKKINSLI